MKDQKEILHKVVNYLIGSTTWLGSAFGRMVDESPQQDRFSLTLAEAFERLRVYLRRREIVCLLNKPARGQTCTALEDAKYWRGAAQPRQGPDPGAV